MRGDGPLTAENGVEPAADSSRDALFIHGEWRHPADDATLAGIQLQGEFLAVQCECSNASVFALTPES